MYPGLHPYIDTYFFVPQEKLRDPEMPTYAI